MKKYILFLLAIFGALDVKKGLTQSRDILIIASNKGDQMVAF